MGIIGSLCEKLDDCVVDVANKSVRTWNWTTGRTKRELAQLLVYMGPIGLSSATYFNFLYLPAAVIVTFIVTGSFSRLSKLTQKLEESALDKGMKDILVERMKRSYKIGGYSLSTMVPIEFACSYGGTNLIDNQLSAISFFSMGAASHVMRAESLPPRKDCIRRGLDKLTEVWDNARAPKPVYATNPLN